MNPVIGLDVAKGKSQVQAHFEIEVKMSPNGSLVTFLKRLLFHNIAL